MPKPVASESEIVMAVNRDTGILDLWVYAHSPKRRRGRLVGTATLRMEDLREVVPMLAERLRIEDLLVRKSTSRNSNKAKAA